MATIDVAALNRQGKVFHTANVSTKAFSVSTTAFTGLILFNPLGSGVKGIIIDWGLSYVTAPTTINSSGLAFATQGTTLPSSTANTTLNALTGLAADGSGKPSQIQNFDVATLVTAVVRRWSGGAAFGDASGVNPYTRIDRVDGSLIIVPGVAVAIQTLTNALVGAVASITWAELPV
jgi:hypothetical protein